MKRVFLSLFILASSFSLIFANLTRTPFGITTFPFETEQGFQNQKSITPVIILFNTPECMLNRFEDTFSGYSLLAEEGPDVVTIDLAKELLKVTYEEDAPEYLKDNFTASLENEVTIKKYEVQAGYFKNYKNAVQLVDKITSSFSQEVRIKKEYKNDETYYRILVGAFNSRQDASFFIKSLQHAGLDGIIKG